MKDKIKSSLQEKIDVSDTLSYSATLKSQYYWALAETNIDRIVVARKKENYLFKMK